MGSAGRSQASYINKVLELVHTLYDCSMMSLFNDVIVYKIVPCLFLSLSSEGKGNSKVSYSGGVKSRNKPEECGLKKR